jgi:hypothetical protein
VPKITGLHYPAPTIQKFLSGSGTYITPSGVRYIKIRMVGGGGQGGSGGTSGWVTGLNGTVSTFGTSLLTANGGGGGQYISVAQNGGDGGTAVISLPAIGTAIKGGTGNAAPSSTSTNFAPTGSGAASPFGGAGNGSVNGTPASGVANTGSGGGGGSSNATLGALGGSGGGAGGYIEALISSPSSTYTYAIGSGGAGTGFGVNGWAGSVGGSGYIEVTEFYE